MKPEAGTAVSNTSDAGAARSPERHGRVRAVAAHVWRLRFTVLLLVALGIAAWLTDSHTRLLTAEMLDRIGFAPRDLWELEVWRVLTSALVTDGAATLALAMVAVGMFVGIAEWRAGTVRAVLTFWGVHLATLLIESFLVALPLHLSGLLVGTALVAGRDVGPSAGYFGCLGLAIMSLKVNRPVRAVAIAVIVVALVGVGLTHLGTSAEEVRQLSAAIAHVIAFPLGIVSWRVGRRSASA